MRKTPLPSLIWSEHPAMVDALTQRLSSMALSESDLVVVVGLEKYRSYNFRPALVLGPPVDGRVPVRLVHGNRKQLDSTAGPDVWVANPSPPPPRKGVL